MNTDKTKANGGVTAAEVEAALPRRFFVKRGDIQRAFDFTKAELTDLIAAGVFVAEYPLGKDRRRARFVRTQVLAAARKWEASK